MVPIGTIVIWSGSLDSIPEGWAHCNGQNGTRDLRQLFVRGALSPPTVGDTGGLLNHSHTFDAGNHDHNPGVGISIHGPGSDTAWDLENDSGQQRITGTTDDTENLPPFMVLAYIQRIS